MARITCNKTLLTILSCIYLAGWDCKGGKSPVAVVYNYVQGIKLVIKDSLLPAATPPTQASGFTYDGDLLHRGDDSEGQRIARICGSLEQAETAATSKDADPALAMIVAQLREQISTAVDCSAMERCCDDALRQLDAMAGAIARYTGSGGDSADSTNPAPLATGTVRPPWTPSGGGGGFGRGDSRTRSRTLPLANSSPSPIPPPRASLPPLTRLPGSTAFGRAADPASLEQAPRDSPLYPGTSFAEDSPEAATARDPHEPLQDRHGASPHFRGWHPRNGQGAPIELGRAGARPGDRHGEARDT
jgi:hypothetical protein